MSHKTLNKHAISAIDWLSVSAQLDARGCAMLPNLIAPAACAELAELYADDARFRSRVVMSRHGFGRGEYKYFSYPLPPLIASLRTALYPHLAPVANEWSRRLGADQRYPATLDEFLERCHAAGQVKPTPLLLQYGPEDYNCLHQDLYGEWVFPLQLTVLLSQPGRDFTGGEFVLTEQRPRMQSRAEVVPLAQGDAVVFAVHHRPVHGTRGEYRVNLRHGVSRVRSGRRHTLGIIFHDAGRSRLSLGFGNKRAPLPVEGHGALLLLRILVPCLLAGVTVCGARAACAQTPSPLQEWQYPGGIELERLFAQEIPEWDRILGLAASAQPVYSGSNRYHASSGPVINIRYRDRVFLATGEGLGVDFLQGKQYRVSLSVGVDLGRREEWDISQLRGLGDIPRAPFVKLSSSYVISRRLPIILRADIRKIAGGSAGLVGDLEVYTPLPGSSRRLVMFAGPSVTIADRKHLQTGYGISGLQSLDSGYPVYSAHGGLESAGFGFSATRFFTPHLLANTDLSAKELLGSAANSPLVQRKTQASFDLSVAYRW